MKSDLKDCDSVQHQITKWNVPIAFQGMPAALRADIRNHYQLEVFTRSRAGQFTCQCSADVPPPIPTLKKLGLPTLILEVVE